ncbi:hypothetical protein CALCODRAFT_481252 [Calocera cornea HHB12733]|uniref:F-box domain-containing protein n=1 Tax=Calocera cornea HHB12733 TaxID=1353952 RepID=A0A165HU45_9BASI|nr:hypothetical protein CALCODRAFT_481252 [Calocera cornea HHB12733]
MTRKEPTVEELVGGLASLATSLCCIRTLELYVDALDFGLFQGFFAALRTASPSFKKLSISASLVVGEAHETHLEQTQTSIAGISGLTHFSWYSDDYYENPIIASVEGQLMKGCPQLQHMSLHFGYDPRILDDYPPAASSRLWEGHWPALKWLQLDRVSTSEHTGAFLDEHVNIETLCLNRDSYPWQELPFQLPETALPKLRQVWWPFKQGTSTLLTLLRPLPDGSRRPIEVLSQITVTTYDNLDPTITTHQSDGFLSDAQFEELCTSLSQMPTLRVLGIENQRASGIAKLAQLASMAPSVEELMIRLRAWPGDETLLGMSEAISNLPRLRSLHLLGVDPWIEHQWIQAAGIFSAASPELVHFSGFDRKGEDWARPKRNGCAVCNEAWPLTLDEY